MYVCMNMLMCMYDVCMYYVMMHVCMCVYALRTFARWLRFSLILLAAFGRLVC